MKKNPWDIELAKQFKKRDNPTDLKEGIIGVVIALDPLSVSIENGQVVLSQDDHLVISEWFKKRCDIDKTTALSVDAVNSLASANAVNILHSNSSPCVSNGAIDSLIAAITKINTELLQLKLDLKVKDKVILIPANIEDKYFIIDKVA